MSIVVAGEIIALILALVEEFRSSGQSLVGWGLAILCLALLWSHFGG